MDEFGDRMRSASFIGPGASTWDKIESRGDTPLVIKKIYDQRDDTKSRGNTPPVIKKMYDLKDDSIRYAQVTNFGACFS
ncbi:hypothetical protein H5410_047159 [Solanum commersonii]|uniref:Uncharacterized protein n=1 Tax=Solanum commersonii TaxID=4109 RepID=A0A9J5XGA9_SOLCO|nr:hypothetical protein H5410_047159 [Solanum commersonii]